MKKQELEVKVERVHQLTQAQLDSLALRLAALPISNKDIEMVAETLIDELGISDDARFYANVREFEVPTPKT